MRKRVIVGVLVATAAGYIILRSKTPPEKRDLRMRRVMNERIAPVLMRRGMPQGEHAPFAIVEHVGRKSGIVRRTVIHPIPLDGRFAISLAYGEAGQWPRNILAAGCARLEYRGEIYELANPRVLLGSEIEGLPGIEKGIGRLFGGQFLVADVASVAPGTFEAETAE